MTRLLKITDLGSGIMVQGTNNVLYPDNATLTYPYNSIIVITDESNIATFRSASNNDVLFSGLIGKIEIGGEIVTKENINTKFDTIANKESGGGGSFADASYDSQTKRINFYDNGGNIVSYIDATDFIKDGMVSNVAISEGNLVITFNTDAGQEPISIALTDIFNAANYYNKTEVDGKLALKADKSEIPDTSEFITKDEYNPKELATAKALTQLNETKADKTELPDVSTFATKEELNAKANTADLAAVATSGSYNDLIDKPVIPESTVVDAALSDTSENPVQNKVVKEAIDEAKAYYINFAALSQQGITDADWDGIVAAINAHRPIYAGLDNRYYTAECLYQDGSNIIRMTASDELNHFFYMFTKRGSNDYTMTYEVRPYTTQAEKDAWSAKQDALVSGTNIKTINNQSILGEGNITIEGGGTINIDQSVISGSSNAVSGGAVYTQLGGLKLEKITQSAYDSLATKDSSTVYFIND